MKESGFNMDFSPVVEINDYVWPGRAFKSDNVEEKISEYIKGLQEEGIYATAKHYPGGNMVKDPHWFIVNSVIKEKDLEQFNYAIEANVSAIMVGHTKVKGAIDSNGKQATISQNIHDELRKDFDGLIITDDISMMGLRWSYLFRPSRIYVDLVKSEVETRIR